MNTRQPGPRGAKRPRRPTDAGMRAGDRFPQEMIARLQRQLDTERSTNSTLRHQLKLAHAQVVAGREELGRVHSETFVSRQLEAAQRRTTDTEKRLVTMTERFNAAEAGRKGLADRLLELERVSQRGNAKYDALVARVAVMEREAADLRVQLREALARAAACDREKERLQEGWEAERVDLLHLIGTARATEAAERRSALRAYALSHRDSLRPPRRQALGLAPGGCARPADGPKTCFVTQGAGEAGAAWASDALGAGEGMLSHGRPATADVQLRPRGPDRPGPGLRTGPGTRLGRSASAAGHAAGRGQAARPEDPGPQARAPACGAGVHVEHSRSEGAAGEAGGDHGARGDESGPGAGEAESQRSLVDTESDPAEIPAEGASAPLDPAQHVPGGKVRSA